MKHRFTAGRQRRCVAVALISILAIACQDLPDQTTASLSAPSRSQRTAAYLPPVANVGLVVGGNPAGNNLTLLPQIGIRLVRHSFSWGDLRRDTTALYREVTQYASANPSIQVLANIAYYFSEGTPPDSVTDPAYASCQTNNVPTYACIPAAGTAKWTALLTEFKPRMKQVIRQSRQQVQYWSFGNEANAINQYGGKAFFSGTDDQFDTLTTMFCQAVHEVTTETGTPLNCVGPEVALAAEPDTLAKYGSYGDAPTNWLVARATNDSIDVISVHWYDQFEKVKSYVNILKGRLPGTRPVWVTETGLHSPTYRDPASDPEFQERDVIEKLRGMRDAPGPIGAVFMFDLVSKFGGITDVGTPRPAYWAIQKFNANTYDASVPLPGYCSNQTSSPALCLYTSYIPIGYGCRMDVRVRDQNYSPVGNAEILYYQSFGNQLGRRVTRSDGIVSFTAKCSVDQGVRFISAPNAVLRAGTSDVQTFSWTVFQAPPNNTILADYYVTR